MERRVVVTGLGAISPIGNNVEEMWEGIKQGKCGIDDITLFDTTDSKVKIAAEVKNRIEKAIAFHQKFSDQKTSIIEE